MDRVLEGASKALNQLVDIHQAFIYNIAWKMTHSNEDALNLTQDVLIKVMTKLSTFKKESAFRTWLYRIVFNEFLQSKRKQKEKAFPSFEEHDRRLNAVPDPELTPKEELELKDYTREVKFRCTSAMLICLDREQRLIYLLGDSFSIDRNVGAEIFGITPQNFRVKLSRARKELHNYMEYRCGLIKKSNPCRCSKKAKSALKMGALNENNLIFKTCFTKKIGNFVTENLDTITDVIDHKYVEIFRNQFNNCVILGDKGYLSADYQLDLFESKQIKLEVPMRKNQQNHKKQTYIFRKKRKRIETLFSQLCDQFKIWNDYAKTFEGFKTRVLSKLTALTIIQYINKFVFNRNINNLKVHIV